jgi:hypothetical protein
MSHPTITKEEFLRNVAEHTIIIIKDEGVYRHIRFMKPQSSDMFFDLITWPGHLCYTGDMGTFVFHRVEDMFSFFRSQELKINPGYWAEKVLAEDTCDGLREYDADAYRTAINEWLLSQTEDEEDREYITALTEAVNDDLLSVADDGEHTVRQAVDDFSFQYGYHRSVQIDDFWETHLTRSTSRYLWCCYALVWGISAYDKMKREKRRGGVW